MNVVMGYQDRSGSNPPTVQHNTSLLRYQYSIVLQECFTLLILVSLHTKVGILIKTFIKMQILTVKLIYQWYNKAVTELLNGQKSWLGSGILNFSLRGKQEWFIASKKNWLLETIIKKKKIQFDTNTRSCWFEDLNGPFGEDNNTKKQRAPGQWNTIFKHVLQVTRRQRQMAQYCYKSSSSHS